MNYANFTKKAPLILVVIVLSFQFAAAQENIIASTITTFVSPDNSYAALNEFLNSANHSIYLNAYTFTSGDISWTLAGISKKNISITVILEDSPAGGLPEEEARAIEILKNASALVYFTNESFRFNHAKYIVVDNASVLVTTENFGESGFPKDNRYGNRGWGAIIVSRELGEYFAELFYRDLAKAKEADLKGKNFVEDEEKLVKKIGYSPVFETKRYIGNFKVVPVVAPENNAALETVLQFLSSANKSIKGEIFYAYKYWGRGDSASVETAPNLFLEEVIKAAERGVEATLLLDSTWYNVDKKDPRSNYHTVEYLNNLSIIKNIPLNAKLLDKSTGIEKLHAKGVAIDGSAVLISSINWNENSPRNNREVGVIIYGEPAKYFEEVFDHDWEGRKTEKTEIYWRRGIALAALLIVLAFYFIRNRKG